MSSDLPIDSEPNETGKVTLDRAGVLATITIHRPGKHNALNLEMWRQLHDAAMGASDDEDIRVVIVRGAGRVAFSAGADISEFTEVRHDASNAREYSDTIERAERALINSRKPTIAMLHGICAGGGCGIALACTLRFADDAFRFAIPASRLGVVYHQTAVDRLVQQVGPSTAMDILISGRYILAEEAYSRRLVDALHPAADLEDRVYDYASQVAKSSRYSVEGAWVGVQAALDPHNAELRREIVRVQADAHDSTDYREGVQAFLDRRQPLFGLNRKRNG
jgi:enoyl-CoA hydratase/carnithine racemase